MENYQKMTDAVISTIETKGIKPRLLLHVCCAPCSSYVLGYLKKYFYITAYFYNPNIINAEEYCKRRDELARFVDEFVDDNTVKIVNEDYVHEEFLDEIMGKEELREGGARCYDCYRLRLDKSGKYASDNGFDYFTTTLSISPHKRSDWLNEIGKELSDKYSVEYLYSDFKKRNGYKVSCELSREYNLYRQFYCGCEFSKKQSEEGLDNGKD